MVDTTKTHTLTPQSRMSLGLVVVFVGAIVSNVVMWTRTDASVSVIGSDVREMKRELSGMREQMAGIRERLSALEAKK